MSIRFSFGLTKHKSWFIGLNILVSVAWLVFCSASAQAANPNGFILNEANSVSGGKFIDKGRGDLYFASDANPVGRVEGHGQNWFEFLAVQGDALFGGGFKNTIDLRGWTIEWEYDKNDPTDPNQYGEGVIEFSNDPLWAAVPQGILLTVSEWQQIWYLNDTPSGYDPWDAGGLQRMGGINGLGNPQGTSYDPGADSLIDFSTDVSWNPNANGGGANGDWHMHVYAGERNPDNSFKYFNFSGSITSGNDTYAIGTDDAGLFAINNDNWQWTIKDAQGNTIQGPYGEQDTGLGSSWRVSSEEIIKLENFNQGTGATQASYLGAAIYDYHDGSSSTFGQGNEWSSGGGHQDLAVLRDWLVEGDIDLDGQVTGRDLLAWQRGYGTTGGASLTSGDLDGNGNVDGADLAIWSNHYGQGQLVSVTSVPEASSLVLGMLSLIGCLAARRANPRQLVVTQHK